MQAANSIEVKSIDSRRAIAQHPRCLDMTLQFLPPFLIAAVALSAAEPSVPVYRDAEAAQHIGETATVTGKVATVSTTGKGTTFINLGARYPDHLFGAIIFAANRDDVGEVKSFEGKEVAISGRIELGRDQKPQIILREASQIKLATPAMPEPMPAATPPTPAPITPPATPQPQVAPPMSDAPATRATPNEIPVSEKTVAGTIKQKITLPPGWKSPRRGGETVRKDLARLLGSYGTASEIPDVDTSIEVYPGIPLLTPLATARRTLNIENSHVTRTQLTTSGFPSGAFYIHEVSGIFPGGYNRISLVTDSDDQIITILLVDSSIRARVPNEPDSTGYHTYNFIAGSGKGVPTHAIRHKVTPPETPGGSLIVDTLLIDPTDPEAPASTRGKKSSRSATQSKPKTGKVLERSRWFVPSSLVNLILRCVGGN